MKTTYLLFAAAALGLAACNDPTPPGYDSVPGDSAGSAGPLYCETVPSNPDDKEEWNPLCAAGGGRR